MKKRVNKRIKKILKRLEHFYQCFNKKKRCIHCLDCIAFALLFAEDNHLTEPSEPYEYLIGGNNRFWIFKKYLLSTIVNEPHYPYFPCKRALTYDEVSELANLLLKLTQKQKKSLRQSLPCHAEFKADQFNGTFQPGLFVLYNEKLVEVDDFEEWKRKHKK